MLRALALLVLLPLLANSFRSPIVEDEARDKFVALFDKKDDKGLAELWRANPYEVLTSIDEDLEGSLATWEKSPDKPDVAAIKTQQERALWGARIASETLKTPIFLDYASSFVGWNDAQKKSFRGGQAAYGRARKALKSGDAAAAATEARACADLALPLGDWWGYAMGLSAEGNALAATQKEKALSSTSQARVIYHDLGLVRDEYACARSLAKLCKELERPERALAAAQSALELAKLLGDEKGQADLTRTVSELEAARAKH